MGVTQFPASTSGAARLVTKANTAGQAQLGSWTSVTADNGVYGSWVQVTASTASEIYIVSLTATTTNVNLADGSLAVRFQIGIGAAASETALATVIPAGSDRALPTTDFVAFQQDLPVLLRIGSGQRVSVRAWSSSASHSLNVALFSVDYANAEGN